MCGRLTRNAVVDWAYYGLHKAPEAAEQYTSFNIGPMVWDLQIHTEPDGRELVASRWGLIPRWAKDRSIGSKMFNARAETLMERNAFKGLVKGHRCVIPASGFYEWHGTGKGKQPFYIHRADGEPLTLAGLWTTWTDPESGEVVPSHTIITTSPNGMMERIHNRMPVVLGRAAMDLWLDEEATDPAEVLPLLVPCPDDVLTAYEVSKAVGNIRNDGPELIEPLDE